LDRLEKSSIGAISSPRLINQNRHPAIRVPYFCSAAGAHACWELVPAPPPACRRPPPTTAARRAAQEATTDHSRPPPQAEQRRIPSSTIAAGIAAQESAADDRRKQSSPDAFLHSVAMPSPEKLHIV
ncbi:Os06g0518300, partial [Oryza sativa Japonica Group]